MTDRSKTLEVMARGLSVDGHVAVCLNLARAGIPPDLIELLVQGDPLKGIAPLALDRAISAALQAEGMAVVPVEPTARMVIAGASAKPIANRMNTLTAAGVWAAMLAASPYGKAVVKEKDDE